MKGWGWSPMVEHLLSIWKVLGLISSMEKQEEAGEKNSPLDKTKLLPHLGLPGQ